MFSSLLLVSAALSGALSVHAQNIPTSASETDLRVVDAEYVNSGIGNVTANDQGTGVPLQSRLLLTAVYNSTAIDNGHPYAADQVASQPEFYATFSSDTLSQVQNVTDWTLIMTDTNTWGNPDPQGTYRHFLASSVTVDGGVPTSGNMTKRLDIGNVITPYAGPAPAAGDGPHRYVFLLLAGNPGQTSITNNEGTPLSQGGHWNVTQYIQQANLMGPYAANFFTVENGDASASVSVVSTQAVDTASIASMASSTASTSASATADSSAKDGAASRDIKFCSTAVALALLTAAFALLA